MQTLLNLLAGVSLLVWGTHIVRTGMLRVFGADLRRILSKSVNNRFSAFLAGLGVTGVVQSSSATALIASSFVSQNLIGLSAALAIMLGADVGTALIAQLFSLDLSWLSPLLIFFGVVFFLSRRESKVGQLGRVAIGLGLMMLALQLVMAATKPITESQGVRVIFSTLSGDPLLDMLIGAAIAVISWSSLAVVLLSATLAASKVVAVPVALCLVLGANLGSGLLALLVNARTAGGGRRVASVRSGRGRRTGDDVGDPGRWKGSGPGDGAGRDDGGGGPGHRDAERKGPLGLERRCPLEGGLRAGPADQPGPIAGFVRP